MPQLMRQLTQHNTITPAEYPPNYIPASQPSLQIDESHCAWSHHRTVSLNQTMREAHNRHLVLLACSQMMFFELLSPTKKHSSAAAQHGSASLPVPNKTWMTGRSHTRLSNPIGSENKREAAISHYSCAALSQPLRHFTWQALSKDGDQSYMLSTWPAPFSASQ